MKALVVFGTRPEAIKMAPVAVSLRELSCCEVGICVTAQHRQMLDQVLNVFDIKPDYDLNIMRPDQDLFSITTDILGSIRDVYRDYRPDCVLVHGDTSTAFASALAAFYKKIPVGHVEAGLRTYDIMSPWPEEANRKLITPIARWHFAPTWTAKNNLLKEQVKPEHIHVTGNTVIDALLHVRDKLRNNESLLRDTANQFPFLRQDAKLVLITGHRRENFGDGFNRICMAIRKLAKVFKDTDFVYPVHLNPNVRKPVNRLLSSSANVHLIEPQDYLSFVYLMDRSHIILTDSGGIQEEAPSLGKPVLVMRECSERPEAIAAGTASLVGTDENKIFYAASMLLSNSAEYEEMRKVSNPYGDGHAAERIATILGTGSAFEIKRSICA
jgi:UDP-N-acetylglucosamine 2-epimerase (non-hydrolysing)